MVDSGMPLSSSWMAKNQDFEFPSMEKNEEERNRRLEALWQHWEQATAGRKNCDVWFHDTIVPMYSERGRFYHTLVHLEEMLGYLNLMLTERDDDTNTSSSIDYQTLVLAIFFHDVVYDPKSANNEEESARLFERFWNDSSCKVDDESPVKERVVRYILATKHHTSADDDESAQLLLDIDMAVLGKATAPYSKYAYLIRKEYEFVDPEVYCEKRAQVLKGFLDNPIFGTPQMKDALEERARENLRREIEALEKGIIPISF